GPTRACRRPGPCTRSATWSSGPTTAGRCASPPRWSWSSTGRSASESGAPSSSIGSAARRTGCGSPPSAWTWSPRRPSWTASSACSRRRTHPHLALPGGRGSGWGSARKERGREERSEGQLALLDDLRRDPVDLPGPLLVHQLVDGLDGLPVPAMHPDLDVAALGVVGDRALHGGTDRVGDLRVAPGHHRAEGLGRELRLDPLAPVA